MLRHPGRDGRTAGQSGGHFESLKGTSIDHASKRRWSTLEEENVFVPASILITDAAPLLASIFCAGGEVQVPQQCRDGDCHTGGACTLASEEKLLLRWAGLDRDPISRSINPYQFGLDRPYLSPLDRRAMLWTCGPVSRPGLRRGPPPSSTPPTAISSRATRGSTSSAAAASSPPADLSARPRARAPLVSTPCTM